MTNTAETDYSQPQRVKFAADEEKFPWLARLLEAYYVIDQGVSKAIEREVARGRSLACAKGCSSCCRTHQDIPVYPLELMGMSWYAIEKMPQHLREQLRTQLENYAELTACPFLIDNACSIHPLRPVACRQFNVLDKSCVEGEDAYHRRRGDVMLPVEHFTHEAFDIMLPFYGIRKKAERRKAIKKGSIHALAKVMRDCHWETLPEKMAAFDKN